MTKEEVSERLLGVFGTPARQAVKIVAWELGLIGIALQKDQPNREDAGYLWLPYPSDGATIPEIALEYPAETGRHSGTYASTGLGKGEPALKLVIRTERELADTVTYIKAMKERTPLPEVAAESIAEPTPSQLVDTSIMPSAKPPRPRREAIPRAAQHEVWQRDGGRCVDCGSKEKLCFDHIIPFSRGGSNSVRNLQLLCERCNLSKGNKI